MPLWKHWLLLLLNSLLPEVKWKLFAVLRSTVVVNTLLEYGLISETGRKDSIGHPILYGTTDKFLITFGLNSLKDLPEFPDILSEHENEPEQMSLMAEFNEELNKTEETEDL